MFIHLFSDGKLVLRNSKQQLPMPAQAHNRAAAAAMLVWLLNVQLIVVGKGKLSMQQYIVCAWAGPSCPVSFLL